MQYVSVTLISIFLIAIMIIITDCISMEGNAIASVRLSVHVSVSTITFEPNSF